MSFVKNNFIILILLVIVPNLDNLLYLFSYFEVIDLSKFKWLVKLLDWSNLYEIILVSIVAVLIFFSVLTPKQNKLKSFLLNQYFLFIFLLGQVIYIGAYFTPILSWLDN